MIRVATEDDFDTLISLGEVFCSELDNLPPNTTYVGEDVRSLLEGLTESPDGTLLLYETDGRLRGMIGLILNPFFFDNSKIVASEYFFYVDEEARSAGIGSEIMEAGIEWAREHGASSMTMTSIAVNKPTNANEVFLKYGFKLFEQVYRASI